MELYNSPTESKAEQKRKAQSKNRLTHHTPNQRECFIAISSLLRDVTLADPAAPPSTPSPAPTLDATLITSSINDLAVSPFSTGRQSSTRCSRRVRRSPTLLAPSFTPAVVVPPSLVWPHQELQRPRRSYSIRTTESRIAPAYTPKTRVRPLNMLGIDGKDGEDVSKQGMKRCHRLGEKMASFVGASSGRVALKPEASTWEVRRQGRSQRQSFMGRQLPQQRRKKGRGRSTWQ